MIKITEKMRDALQEAVNDAGSQVKFGEKAGIASSRISRYLSGKCRNVSPEIWKKLVPHFTAYLSKKIKPLEEIEHFLLSQFRLFPSEEKQSIVRDLVIKNYYRKEKEKCMEVETAKIIMEAVKKIKELRDEQ